MCAQGIFSHAGMLGCTHGRTIQPKSPAQTPLSALLFCAITRDSQLCNSSNAKIGLSRQTKPTHHCVLYRVAEPLCDIQTCLRECSQVSAPVASYRFSSALSNVLAQSLVSCHVSYAHTYVVLMSVTNHQEHALLSSTTLLLSSVFGHSEFKFCFKAQSQQYS